MEDKEQIVVYTDKASDSIDDFAVYIAERGYPETAHKFREKLYDFGNSLANFPDAFPKCKQPQFAKRNMHCAVFHKNYIFVYKRVKNNLVVYNVIHVKTNPVFHPV